MDSGLHLRTSFTGTKSVDGNTINYGEAWMVLPGCHTRRECHSPLERGAQRTREKGWGLKLAIGRVECGKDKGERKNTFSVSLLSC